MKKHIAKVFLLSFICLFVFLAFNVFLNRNYVYGWDPDIDGEEGYFRLTSPDSNESVDASNDNGSGGTSGGTSGDASYDAHQIPDTGVR